jgi:hypothetical protein
VAGPESASTERGQVEVAGREATSLVATSAVTSAAADALHTRLIALQAPDLADTTVRAVRIPPQLTTPACSRRRAPAPRPRLG